MLLGRVAISKEYFLNPSRIILKPQVAPRLWPLGHCQIGEKTLPLAASSSHKLFILAAVTHCNDAKLSD